MEIENIKREANDLMVTWGTLKEIQIGILGSRTQQDTALWTEIDWQLFRKKAQKGWVLSESLQNIFLLSHFEDCVMM